MSNFRGAAQIKVTVLLLAQIRSWMKIALKEQELPLHLQQLAPWLPERNGHQYFLSKEIIYKIIHLPVFLRSRCRVSSFWTCNRSSTWVKCRLKDKTLLKCFYSLLLLIFLETIIEWLNNLLVHMPQDRRPVSVFRQTSS